MPENRLRKTREAYIPKPPTCCKTCSEPGYCECRCETCRTAKEKFKKEN